MASTSTQTKSQEILASKLQGSFDTQKTSYVKIHIAVSSFDTKLDILIKLRSVWPCKLANKNIPDSIFLAHNKKHIVKHRHVGR